MPLNSGPNSGLRGSRPWFLWGTFWAAADDDEEGQMAPVGPEIVPAEAEALEEEEVVEEEELDGVEE